MSDTKTFVVPEYMGGGDNDLAKIAMLNNGGMGGWNSNPFFYLIWMWMMRYMNGNGDDNNSTQRQIQTLQDTVQDNHNSDLLMQAVNGNENAIREFSATTGLNFSAVQNAICGVRNAIAEVGAQLGFSSEKVINAINQGDCSVIQAVKDAGCGTQQAILKMGYENQLANERQTTALNQSIAGLSNQLDRNASTIEFNTQQQTCQLQNTIKDASNDSTSQILAKLNSIEDSRKDREINALTAELAAAKARAERQAELAPLLAQINDVRRNQPSTTTIEYPQLTAIPTNQLYMPYVAPYNVPYGNTGYWG